MKFVMHTGIVLAGAVLWCALAHAQRNLDLPGSASKSENPFIDQNAFDKTLKRILRESPSHFEAIRASRVENRRRDYFYEPKIYLPGAWYCRILKHEGATIYTCEWENRKTVNNWYTPLVAAIEHSLGLEWNKRAGLRQTDQQVLFSGDRKPTVQVIWRRKAAVVQVVVLPEEASHNGIQTALPVLPDFFHP
jgi:hypothetical protein